MSINTVASKNQQPSIFSIAYIKEAVSSLIGKSIRDSIRFSTNTELSLKERLLESKPVDNKALSKQIGHMKEYCVGGNPEISEDLKAIYKKVNTLVGVVGNCVDGMNGASALTSRVVLGTEARTIALVSTSSNFVNGILNMAQARVDLRNTHKGDIWGMIKNGFAFFSGALQGLGGVLAGSIGSLGVIATKTCNKVVLVAQQRLQLIKGNLGFVILGTAITRSSLNLYHTLSFAKGLHKEVEGESNTLDGEKVTFTDKGRLAGLEYFLSKLELTDEERDAVQYKYPDDDYLGKGTIPKADWNLLSKDDLCFLAGKMESEDDVAISLLAAELIALKKIKQNRFIRRAGAEAFAQIKPFVDSYRREVINSLDGESEFVPMEWMEKQEKKEKIDSAFCSIGHTMAASLRANKGKIIALTLLTLYLTLAILAVMATGGTLAIVAAGGLTLLSLIFVLQDMQSLLAVYNKKDRTAMDKFLLGLVVTFAVASLLLGAVFSWGTGILIAGMVIGALWAVLYGYSYIKWSNDDKEEEKGISNVQELNNKSLKETLEKDKKYTAFSPKWV